MKVLKIFLLVALIILVLACSESKVIYADAEDFVISIDEEIEQEVEVDVDENVFVEIEETVDIDEKKTDEDQESEQDVDEDTVANDIDIEDQETEQETEVEEQPDIDEQEPEKPTAPYYFEFIDEFDGRCEPYKTRREYIAINASFGKWSGRNSFNVSFEGEESFGNNKAKFNFIITYNDAFLDENTKTKVVAVGFHDWFYNATCSWDYQSKSWYDNDANELFSLEIIKREKNSIHGIVYIDSFLPYPNETYIIEALTNEIEFYVEF